jgi:hypothetical protein
MQCKHHHPAKVADTKTRKKAAPGPRERAAIKARYDEILKDPDFRPRTDFPVGKQKFVEFVNEQFGEGPLPPPQLQVVRKEGVQEGEKKEQKVDEPQQDNPEIPHLQVVRKESIQEGEKKINEPHLQVARKESIQEGVKEEKNVDEPQQDNPEIPHLQVVRKEGVQEYEKKVDEPTQQAKRSDYKHGEAGEAFVNEHFGDGPLPTPHLQVVRKESVQEYEKKVDEPTQQAKRSEYKHGEAGEAFVNEQFGDGPLPTPHLQVVRKESVQEYEKKVDEPMQQAKRCEYKHGEAGEALRQLAPQLRICKQEGVLNNTEVSQAIFDRMTTHEKTAQTSWRIVTAYEGEVPAKLEGGSSFDGTPGGEGEGAGVPEATAQHPDLLGPAQGWSKATTADIEGAQMAQKRYYHEFTTENRDDDEDDDDDNHPVTHEPARIYRITHPSRQAEAKGIG